MDIKDTREEIIKRSQIVIEQHRARTKRVLEGVSVVLMALLIIVMRQIPYTVVTEMENSYYGTLLQGRDVGMYIIVGLICFILGVVITLIAVKYRDKNNDSNQSND